jgi:hypothetical protein
MASALPTSNHTTSRREIIEEKAALCFCRLSFLLAGCVGGNGGTDTRYNVSGRVVDSNGHGIPGARIVYEGVESSGTEESGRTVLFS